MTKVFCLYRVSTKSQVNYVDTEETIKEDTLIRLISARHATPVEKNLYNNTMYGRY